jgi:peptidoglycan/xylan/chitin deacetylase (PgdA/CDA1 family)
MISFTFDDGNKSIRSVAEPILRRYGMVGTVGAICNLVFWNRSRGQYLLELEDLHCLAESGWEIASHSLFHRRMSLLPLSYQDEEASWHFDHTTRAWVAETRWEDVGTVAYRERFLRRARSPEEFTALSEGFLVDPSNSTISVKIIENNIAEEELRLGSAERELAQSKELFRTSGINTSVFIVPLSTWSPELHAMGVKYYSYVAGGGRRLNTGKAISDRFLSRIGTGADVTLEEVTAKAEAHLSQNSWAIIQFHDIAPEMKGKWNWTTRQFEQLVKWVNEQGVPVCTLSEGARRLMS